MTGSLPDDAPVPGGVIAGRIEGRAVQAVEVVLSGPDSALALYARIRVVIEAGAGRFLAKGLPPGRYFVAVMGEKGASITLRPPLRSLSVGPDGGARADFSVEESH